MRLIDADALVEAMLEARREETDTVLKLIRFIEKQSTIEPKCADGCIYGWESEECNSCRLLFNPKRGRWIIDRKFGADIMSDEQMVICSECKQGIFWGRQNYCPNCGVKMNDPCEDCQEFSCDYCSEGKKGKK